MCSNLQRGYLLSILFVSCSQKFKRLYKENVMRDPLDSAFCLAVEIARAAKKNFYLYLQATGSDGRCIMSFKRESIGGKVDEAIRRACLNDMMLLTDQARKEGITLLGSLSPRSGGVRNKNHMAIVYGWDKGGTVDLMLSLMFEYCLDNPVLLEGMFLSYENLEDRDNVVELDSQLYGPFKHTVEGFYDTKVFPLSKTFQIKHRFNSASPHNSTAICVLTEDPKAMIHFIAKHTGLIVTDFEGGKFSVGLLFEGKRLEIVAGLKAIPKK